MDWAAEVASGLQWRVGSRAGVLGAVNPGSPQRSKHAFAATADADWTVAYFPPGVKTLSVGML